MTADDARAGPPTGHPDLDTIADLQAGVLDEAEATQVRGHLDGCAQCSAALAALDSVQAQLRSLPAAPMPAAIVARLDATLADLRTERPVRRPAAAVRDPEDQLALARARRAGRLSKAIGAVAAAVVVIAAGGAVAAIVRTATTTSSDSATGGGGSADSAATAPRSAAAPDKATAQGGGQLALPAYDRSSLRAALPTIAAQGTALATGPMSDPARRTACGGSIPGVAGSLRGVQAIRYGGRPAYVFVYDDGGRLAGYVVTDACGSAPGLPAAVLDTVS